METKRLFHITTAFIVILLSVLVVGLSSTLIVGFVLKRKSLSPIIQKKEMKEYSYQTLRLNAESGEVTRGVSTIFTELKEDEFIFTRSGDKLELISHFGTEEYRCAGSCTCEQSESRRIAGYSTITKPVIYLVAALSSAFAIVTANEYFEDECERIFEEDSISCSSITTVTDDCFGWEIDFSDTEEELLDSPDDFRKYLFWCEGHCSLAPPWKSTQLKESDRLGFTIEQNIYGEKFIDRDLLLEDKSPETKFLQYLVQKEILCERMKMESFVRIDESKINSEIEPLLVVKMEFHGQKLMPFCDQVDLGKDDFSFLEGVYDDPWFTWSGHEKICGTAPYIESVNCRKLSPIQLTIEDELGKTKE